MYYCLIDCLALLVLLITNHDVLLRTPAPESPVQKHYRYFLYAVIIYYILDFIWAWLYEIQELAWLYLDTEGYFIVMAVGIMLWIRYVVAYLGLKSGFSKFLLYAGWVLVIGVIIVTPINRFCPVMFHFDSNGIYYGGVARHVMFVYQIIILLLTAFYTLIFSQYSSMKERKRQLTIGLSGLIMMIFVAVQIFFSTYPLYAISYMLGGCLLRTFVIENEREEYHENLEIALEREQKQMLELKRAWNLAYKDGLTGVKNKLAYAEKVALIDKQIAMGTSLALAVAVFDVNDLKTVNDTLGHDVGDQYIKTACRLICNTFKKSPVYRVGGDEFAVILEGADYDNREALVKEFNDAVEKNRRNKDVVIAIGMAEYTAAEDSGYKQIFDRGDEAMYKRKVELKSLEN